MEYFVVENKKGEKFLAKHNFTQYNTIQCYGYVVGYKIQRGHVSFTYDQMRSFKRDMVTITGPVKLDANLIEELLQQYFLYEMANGNNIVHLKNGQYDILKGGMTESEYFAKKREMLERRKAIKDACNRGDILEALGMIRFS